MKVALNKAHWPVTTLGYGKRIGLWFQGCSIGCPGCCSQDTWESRESDHVDIADIVAWVESVGVSHIDGFTISGGEPLDQPEALLGLLQLLRGLGHADVAADILLYTGYSWKTVQKKYPDIVALCDLIIAGPYVARLPHRGLAGSNNQQVVRVSELAGRRYSPDEEPVVFQQRAIQVQFDGTQLYMIGIPERASLNQMEAKLANAGVRLEDVSWRS